MGRRGKLKQTRREIREAFAKATEKQKAALMLAMEQRMGLPAAEVLKVLRAR